MDSVFKRIFIFIFWATSSFEQRLCPPSGLGAGESGGSFTARGQGRFNVWTRRRAFDPLRQRHRDCIPQARYHVPRSWFQPSGNILVIFEEKGGDPTKISFGRRRVTGLCGFVSEDYPSVDLESWDKSFNNTSEGKAALQLTCPESMAISSIKFASYGNPSGTCGTYSQGNCHYSNTNVVIEKACLNKNGCTVSVSEESFWSNLCPGITKSLAVEATCS